MCYKRLKSDLNIIYFYFKIKKLSRVRKNSVCQNVAARGTLPLFSLEEWVPPEDDNDLDVNWDWIEASNGLNLQKDPEVNDYVLVKLNENKKTF